ncbi:glycosyltransferase family 2 protein [Nocardioides sp. GY 10127]|uniref:glycosyltransferase n=1 Tax=Nocardioides sp. GY 10127 TaxID=2569762 RepID=UPI0010A89E83|nr:glycosyltransferase family 2 protein [Nocardioides sp. GY 10127]TIC81799.1 hypothetical protein E8D37_11510 [Nocardioides sp. GY 10127]
MTETTGEIGAPPPLRARPAPSGHRTTAAPRPEDLPTRTWHRRRPGPRRTRLAAAHARRSRGRQAAVEVAAALLGPPLLGFLVYLPLAFWLPHVLQAWFWVVFVLLLLTTLQITTECARAARFPEPPLRHELPDEHLPTLAAVVAAYLPNETDVLLESVLAHLRVDYPVDRLLVVVAYNGPAPEGSPAARTERGLAELAAVDERVLPLRVEGSGTKAENVMAALRHLEGVVDVVAVFDADHHPDPQAPRRAARWLSDAAGDRRFDVVQGQCVIRNRHDSFVARTVAAEFAVIYAVAHPGRTVVHDFGIFGGSNGWWRTDVLAQVGLDPAMLTEDIDASVRALAAGARLGTDPRLVSSELAPTTWRGLWTQRMRWAQGWWEVSLRHLRPLLRDRSLTRVHRRGIALLLGWRVAHPFVAAQVVPILAARLVAGDRLRWDLLPMLVAACAVLGISVLQAAVAWRLAPPGHRHPGLYVRYALVGTLFYGQLKGVTTQAAVVRDWLGVHRWEITGRTSRARRAGHRTGHRAGHRRLLRAAR